MNLTLLCGANPAKASRGPSVRLQAGRWRLHCESLKDSSLYLTMESNGETISIQHEAEFVLEKAEIVWLAFRHRGKEGSLTINVKKVA